jgi:hypothetical protein
MIKRTCTLTTLLVFVFIHSTGFSADINNESSYSRAIAALDKNDCLNAIIELKAFKKEESEQLKKHPEFAQQIDQQIKKCMVIMSRKAGGTSIKGRIDPDKFDKNEVKKEYNFITK